MKPNKKAIINLIFVIIITLCIQAQTIFAKYNDDITVKNNYIKDEELTYRKEENGKTLISGFKIGEKISDIVNGKFGDDYEIKIIDNEAREITTELNRAIGTGNRIEIYPKDETVSLPEKTYTAIIYGDVNGDGNVGAVDALAIVKNKIGTETYKSVENEEAGRIKDDTRITGVTPKADDALYIIKYKLSQEEYPIDQKMPGTQKEESIENGNNIDGKINGTLTGEDYNYNNPVIPVGFKTVDTEEAKWKTRDGEIVEDWNNGLTIEDKLGNQFVWVPAILKEEQTEENKPITIYEKWLAEENDETITNIENLKEDIYPSRIENEQEQIKKYKGFYISKYEAGIPEEMIDAIKIGNKQTRNVKGTPIIKKNQTNWNFIDYKTAKINAETMYQTKNVQSGLVTGTQWDTLIKWQEEKETNKPIIIELQEWTNETNNPYRITRGQKDEEEKASYRKDTLPEETKGNLGYRIVLYIQETKLPTEMQEKITMNLLTSTPRNTLKTGVQNGIEAGPIKVNINYGETYLQNQYKKETDENWTTVYEENVQVEITQNETIMARYYDGKKAYKTTSITIQNVDNIAPEITKNQITVDGTKISILATANDTASEKSHPETAGIARMEYSIDGKNYQSKNNFTVENAGTYTIFTKAIDKAGNETIKEETITINEYEITFDPNGGTVTPTSKKVIQNTAYGDLPIPTRTGYTFNGWYTSATNGTRIENLNIANIEKNQTLYAHWIEKIYIITLDNQNAATAGTTEIFEKYNTGIYKESLCKTQLTTNKNNITVPTKIGYTFEGYYEQEAGAGEQLINKTGKITNKLTATKYTDNATIYAKWTANKYTVTYNANGGTVTPASKTVTYNEKYGELATPTRAGYTFTGWYTDKTNGTKIESETQVQITTNQTLYAHWTANKYTVNFDVNGGEPVTPETKEVTYDAKYGNLPTPTRTGYTFTGWYTSATNGTLKTKDTKVAITTNETLYAHWQINNYTLTIKHYLENPNNENFTLAKTTTVEEITYKTPIQLSNYKTEIENGAYQYGKLQENGEIAETTTMGTGTTIYLYYARDKYTLTLNTGDNIQEVTGTGLYKVGQTVEINATLKPNETGYTNTWDKWESNDEEILENQPEQRATITMPKENVTLMAIGIKTPNKYTINFDANEGTLAQDQTTKQVIYDDTYGELPIPSRTGHTFSGWYTSASEELGETLVTENSKVTITQDQTLYAHWITNDVTIEIKHYLENPNNDNYTLLTSTNKTIPYGTTINLEEQKTEIENGTYHYATTTEDGEEETSTVVGLDTQIHIYYKRNIHTLTLIVGENIETVIGQGNYKVGQEVEINANLKESPEGYTINWKEWESSNQSILENINEQATIIEMPKQDITLTAIGTKVPNKYQVNFNANGGTVEPENKTVNYEEEYGEMPIPEKEGNTFIGWYTLAEGGNKVEDTTKVTQASEHTLYAHWTANPYTLTVKHYLENPNDDDFSLKATTTVQDIIYGSSINLENYKIDLKDESNTVIGVYKEGKLTQDGEATQTGIMGTETVIHLYYTRKTYTLTLNKGENIEEVTGSGIYKAGQSVEINAILKNEAGFTTSWAGWSNNDITTIDGTGTQNLIIKMPSRDVTLTANATKTPRRFTVTYNVNGGTNVEPTSKNINYNEEYGELPTTTKPGYEFKGWYTSLTGGEKIESTTIYTSLDDQEIYARWEATNYTLTVKHYLENANNERYTHQEREDTTFDVSYGTPITLEDKKIEITNGTYHHASITEGGEPVEETTMGVNTVIYLYYNRNKYELSLVEGDYIATVTGAQEYKVDQTVRINATLEEDEQGYTNAWSKWISSDKNLLEDNETQNATITMPAGNVTLTAKATRTAKKYTVNFDVNGGEELINPSKQVDYSEMYGDLPTPEKEGYEFKGWYTSAINGTKVESETQVTTAADHTIYAHWEVKDYELTVKHYLENPNDNGYTYQRGKDTTDTVTYGEEIILANQKTEIEDGRTYHHASITEGGEPVETTTMGLNTIIYLYYSRDTYELTLTPGEYIEKVVVGEEEGEVKANKIGTYKVGQTVQINAIVEKDATGYAYSWSGWTSSDTNLLANNTVQEREIEMPRGNVTLTANGKRNANTYIVTFNVNGGNELEEESRTKEVTYDATYGTMPEPTRTGYTFKGWYTDATQETEETKIESTTQVAITEAQTLYAHWTANTYTVTFDVNGGNELEEGSRTKEVIYDATYGTMPEPTRTGYTFKGWYTDATQETEETKIQSTTQVAITEAQTIYAHWTANTYTVTFDANGGNALEEASREVTFDSVYGELPVPEKEGHNFLGWFEGTVDEAGEITYGEPVTAETVYEIADNHTIYASWEAKMYTVKVMHYLENANDDDYTEQVPGEEGYYTFQVPYGTVLTYEDYAVAIENGTFDYGEAEKTITTE